MNTQLLFAALIVFAVIIIRVYILFVNGNKKEEDEEATLEEVIERAKQLLKNNMHLELQRYIKKELMSKYASVELRSFLAHSYFKTGNHQGAAAHFEAILHLDEKNFDAKLMRAHCLKLSGQSKKAIPAYEEILIEKPNEPSALKSLADLCLNAGMKDLALKYLELYVVIEKDPEEIHKIRSKIAKLNLDLGNHAQAAAAYDALQENNPENTDLMLVRANIYLKLQDWQKCLDIYNEYLKYKPDDKNIYEKIGQMKFNLGLWDEALELYGDIINNEDSSSQNYIHHQNRVAEIYVNQGKCEIAIEILSDLIKKYPTEDLLAFTLAQAYISLGDFEKAVNLYTNLMENLPQDQVSIIKKHISDLIGAWGTELFNEGETSLAFDKFFLALKYDENNADIYYKLGTSNFHLKSFNDAIAHFRRAIALSPQESDYYLALGYAFDELGDSKNAKMSFNEAAAINPMNVKAHNALAMSLAKEQNLETALEQFEKVLEFTPDDPDVNYNYALAFELNGDKDNAIRYYRKALAVMPEHIEAQHNLSLLLGYDISEERARII